MPGRETAGTSSRADRPGDRGTGQRRGASGRRPGDQVDKWTLIKHFDKGGSGEVWAARDESGREAALKILWNKKYRARFLDEIRIYRNLGNHPGIVPLIDASLPSDGSQSSAANPWLAMEIAIPLVKYLGPNPDLALTVQAVNEFAKTLAALAENDIHHRDIKPSNLYWLHGDFAIGDFGIADFPDKAGLTQTGDKLGPANFLAPEMIECSGEVKSGPADVYSLAKTLWAVAAGRRFPPPGELRIDKSAFRLSSYAKDSRAAALESLIESSTAHEAARRPSMQEFSDELSWWAEPEVAIKPDLSQYRDEVRRIREASRIIRPETDEQRIGRFRDKACDLIQRTLFRDLLLILETSCLQRVGADSSEVRWPYGDDYGGSWTSAEWGIDTLASPWMELRAGIFRREHPAPNDDEWKIGVLLAMRMASTQDNPSGTQENSFYSFESFKPGSIALDRLAEHIKAQFGDQLPGIVGKFLTVCKSNGIPR